MANYGTCRKKAASKPVKAIKNETGVLKMKKWIALIAVLALSAAMLSGCALNDLLDALMAEAA